MGNDRINWKAYEWLVAKIYQENLSSDDVPFYDEKILGKSGVLRQIDCLIRNISDFSIKTVLEFRKWKKPLTIKHVDEFIGKLEDLGDPNGIIISSSGFTKGALKRLKKRANITCETIGWEEAFRQLETWEFPRRIPQICPKCSHQYEVGKNLPGIILWQLYPLTKIDHDVASVFWIGNCLKCESTILYCDACGNTTIVDSKEFFCKDCGQQLL